VTRGQFLPKKETEKRESFAYFILFFAFGPTRFGNEEEENNSK